jgi:hypothetical protein
MARLVGPGRPFTWIGAVTSALAWPALAVEILVWNDAAAAEREKPHLAPLDGSTDQHLDGYAMVVALASALGPAMYVFGRFLERRTGQ